MTRLRSLLWPLSVVMALLLGIAIGSRVISAVYEPEVKALEAKCDKAIAERDLFQRVLKSIVEGDQPEAMVKGRTSEGN